MTRKDFQALADMLKGAECLNDTQRHYLACKLADLCQEQNPRFDRKRFVAACGA
jgi:hypothetical protein